MKKLILILLTATIFVGCKKSTTKPVETPADEPCATKSKIFEGKYIFGDNTADTMTVTFIQNNCPERNSNRYSVKNIYNCVKNSITTIQDKDYIFWSTESDPTGYMVTKDGSSIKITISSNGKIIMSISSGNSDWKKVQ